MNISTYVNSAAALDEPAAEHGGQLSVAEFWVDGEDLLLHLLLQQQTPKPPVQELSGRHPIQLVLSKYKEFNENMKSI